MGHSSTSVKISDIILFRWSIVLDGCAQIQEKRLDEIVNIKVTYDTLF